MEYARSSRRRLRSSRIGGVREVESSDRLGPSQLAGTSTDPREGSARQCCRDGLQVFRVLLPPRVADVHKAPLTHWGELRLHLRKVRAINCQINMNQLGRPMRQE